MIEKINSSALVGKKKRALRNLTYSEKEEGIQFLEKVRNLLKAVEPNYTVKRLFDAIRNTLPADIDRQVTNFRVMTVKHLTDILITTHEAYLERVGKIKGKKNLNNKTEKEDKLAKNENKGPNQYNNNNRSPQRPRNKRNVTCNKCHRQGHYASECRIRLKDEDTDLKNKDYSVNAVSASETQTVEGKKTDEYSYQKFVSITSKNDTRIIKGPKATFKIYDHQKKKLETVSALLDTGAEVSVVHQELAFKQNWKIFKTDVIVFGSCEDPLQIVGETYVMIVPEGVKLLDTLKVILHR